MDIFNPRHPTVIIDCDIVSIFFFYILLPFVVNGDVHKEHNIRDYRDERINAVINRPAY